MNNGKHAYISERSVFELILPIIVLVTVAESLGDILFYTARKNLFPRDTVMIHDTISAGEFQPKHAPILEDSCSDTESKSYVDTLYGNHGRATGVLTKTYITTVTTKLILEQENLDSNLTPIQHEKPNSY